jgi:hypothetical protein
MHRFNMDSSTCQCLSFSSRLASCEGSGNGGGFLRISFMLPLLIDPLLLYTHLCIIVEIYDIRDQILSITTSVVISAQIVMKIWNIFRETVSALSHKINRHTNLR